jgi:hypothetical protein
VRLARTHACSPMGRLWPPNAIALREFSRYSRYGDLRRAPARLRS